MQEQAPTSDSELPIETEFWEAMKDPIFREAEADAISLSTEGLLAVWRLRNQPPTSTN